MKRKHLSLTALLVATLACPCAQQAWSAERAKLPAGKKRPAPAKAPHPASEPTPVVCPETPIAAHPTRPQSDSGVLKLMLTTSLRQLPAAPAITAAPSSATPVQTPAPVAAIATVPAAPRAAVEPAAATPPAVATAPTPPAATTDTRAPAAVAAPFAPPPAPAPWAVLTPPPPRAYNPPPAPFLGGSKVNPYLPRPIQREAAIQTEPARPAIDNPFSNPFSGLGLSIPLLPDSGQSILPKITKVYPTGEKPLVVVSFKCPTEVVGITPPTIKLLHEAVSLGMAGLNKTDLLSFDLQQVCQ